jgi:hypothetical protein
MPNRQSSDEQAHQADDFKQGWAMDFKLTKLSTQSDHCEQFLSTVLMVRILRRRTQR